MENKNRQINQRAKNKGYTVNATAAYTLNCVDRHSRVTCQSWHVYVSLRPGSQICERSELSVAWGEKIGAEEASLA